MKNDLIENKINTGLTRIKKSKCKKLYKNFVLGFERLKNKN
jgi:hypothetical protein